MSPRQVVLALCVICACSHRPVEPDVDGVGPPRATFAPANGSTLMLVGQDLASVRAYLDSGCCPSPAGTTTYVGLYAVLSAGQAFGGLGVDRNGDVYDFETDWGGGPTHLVRAAATGGGVLAVGLDMTDSGDRLRRIPNGDFDPQIDHLARTLAALPNPILLRIGYEFDGHWNAGYGDADAYIAAYRHIARRVVDIGADNVAFVWQSSASLVDDILDARRDVIDDWYPGDDLVDWVGLSWFLTPDTVAYAGTARRRQSELIDEIVDFARSKRKPVMIAEAAPQGFHLANGYRANIAPLLDGPSGGDRRAVSGQEIWAAWYKPFFDYIDANRDAIRAVAYINALWDEQGLWDAPYENGFWGDSRVQANAEVRAAWNATLAEPVWQHGGQELFDRIGFTKRNRDLEP